MNGNRKAFTLIELVISALLTAIMMAVLLSVLWSSLRQGSLLDKNKANQFPMTMVSEQLRSDFQNAQSYRVDGKGISIAGFIGRDHQSRLPNMTPGIIRYEAINVGDQLALVRRDLAQRNPRSELVRIGVSRVRFQSLVESGDSMRHRGLTQPGFNPMPSEFRITLMSSTDNVLFREVIYHHGE